MKNNNKKNLKKIDNVSKDFGFGNSIEPKTSRRSRHRRFVFTLNNYTDENVSYYQHFFNLQKYKFIFGKEIGDSGTPHLQGYFEHKNQIDFTLIKKYLPRAHFEKAKSSRNNNIGYCGKDLDYYTNFANDLCILCIHNWLKKNEPSKLIKQMRNDFIRHALQKKYEDRFLISIKDIMCGW